MQEQIQSNVMMQKKQAAPKANPAKVAIPKKPSRWWVWLIFALVIIGIGIWTYFYFFY